MRFACLNGADCLFIRMCTRCLAVPVVCIDKQQIPHFFFMWYRILDITVHMEFFGILLN